MEDNEIVELYFKRDENAIAQTQQKYGKLCHGIAKKIVGNESDAEECVNDTYYGIWQAIPPERPSNFCAFVAKVARNLSLVRLKYMSADKRNAEALLSLSELEEIIPDACAFEDIEDREVGGWINDFLYAEDEETRNIFIRKYWYFDSIDELSRRFGHSHSKIKSLLYRTRNKLKEYLTEKGVAL